MTTVINSAGVVLDPVTGPVRGTVTLTGRIVNAGGGPSTVRFQAAPSGTSTWVDIPGCGPAAGPVRTCAVDTTGITGYYDWRAVGLINGTTYYDYESHVLVDNTLPTVALTVPAAPLTGTVNLTATASDAHSGMASVRFEYRKSGVTTWTTCVLDTSSPYACSLNTTTLTDGTYEFRATATDRVGNAAVTATTTRTITNNACRPGDARRHRARDVQPDRNLAGHRHPDRRPSSGRPPPPAPGRPSAPTTRRPTATAGTPTGSTRSVGTSRPS